MKLSLVFSEIQNMKFRWRKIWNGDYPPHNGRILGFEWKIPQLLDLQSASSLEYSSGTQLFTLNNKWYLIFLLFDPSIDAFEVFNNGIINHNDSDIENMCNKDKRCLMWNFGHILAGSIHLGNSKIFTRFLLWNIGLYFFGKDLLRLTLGMTPSRFQDHKTSCRRLISWSWQRVVSKTTKRVVKWPFIVL